MSEPRRAQRPTGLPQVVELAPEPLALALRWAMRQRGEARRELVLEALARFGDRLDRDASRELLRLPQGLDAEERRALFAALPPRSNLGGAWCRVALCEAAGEWGAAAALCDEMPDGGWGEPRAARLLARARNLLRAGAPGDAAGALRGAAKAATAHRTLQAITKVVERLRETSAWVPARRVRIGLVGSVTLDLLAPVLRAALFAHGIDAELLVAPFGQYQQQILDPDSELAAFGPEIVMILLDPGAFGGDLGLPLVDELRGLWRVCATRWEAVVIQHGAAIPAEDPLGRLAAALPEGTQRRLRRVNLAIWEAASEDPHVAVLDLDEVAARHGKERWEDPALWHSARQYPAPAALPLLARHQAALVRALLGLSSKCLVLDLDNTLWGGVLGEDGLAGIRLGGDGEGAAFSAFQRYVKGLAGRGVILAACSKNARQDALAPFERHPEMVLRQADFAAFVANWRPKDENLRQIAEILDIDLGALVFVDDSLAEREWIRRALPEVEVPEMPADPALYVATLDAGRYFEAVALTPEDRARTGTYQVQAARHRLAEDAPDLESFLRQLQLRVVLEPFRTEDLPRLTQLINKTHQFNLTTRRLSAAQVAALVSASGVYTQSMRLSDRLGDHGLTGVLVARLEGDAVRIDHWLMSCRVMGLQVEVAMLAALVGFARRSAALWILGEMLPTARNEPVRDLFDRLGFERVSEDAAGARGYRVAVAAQTPEPRFLELEDRTALRGQDGHA